MVGYTIGVSNRRGNMKSKILVGDVLNRISDIPDQSVQCVVTSPPYWGLRDYGNDQQIGLEQNPQDYIDAMVQVFNQVKRVLADDGVLWLNLGDSYVGGKGQSGSMGGDYQASRNDSGASLNMAHQTLGGQKQTKPTDNRAMMRSAGLKPKDLVGIPWRVALALQADGWYLRQDIIWAKPNPMPESVLDRCTKSHEYLFMLTKSSKYYFDNDAIKEQSANLGATKIRFGGNKYGDSDDPKHDTKSGNEYTDTGFRNKRDVWTVPTKPFRGAHFAVMPEALVQPCVLASSKVGDTVFDPFSGSGTVGVVANRLGRHYIGCELNEEYAKLSRERLEDANGLYAEVEVA